MRTGLGMWLAVVGLLFCAAGIARFAFRSRSAVIYFGMVWGLNAWLRLKAIPAWRERPLSPSRA